MSSIILRRNKTTPLTFDEMDDNLNSLNTSKSEKSDFSNVNNTSDANKPVSLAQQAALDLKANAANPATTGTLNHTGDATFSGNVGIGGYVNCFYLSLTGSQSGYHTSYYGGRSFRKSAASSAFEMVNQNNTVVTHTFGDDGSLLVNQPAGLGYGAGAGGTVTQSTSKSTSVTLNKPVGVISTHNESMLNGSFISFLLNNSLITPADIIVVSVAGGSVGPYRATVSSVQSGSCVITIQNNSGVTASDILLVNFAIIKGSTI